MLAPRADDTEPRVKGLAFRSALEAIRTLRSDEGLAATLNELPAAVADPLRFGAVVASGWFPLASYSALLSAAQRAARFDIARAVGRTAFRANLEGTYHAMTFPLHPQAIVTRTPRTWGLHFDRGRLVVVEARAGMAQFLIEQGAGFDAVVWESIVGAVEGTLEACGARHLRMHVAAGGEDGDVSIEIQARWATSNSSRKRRQGSAVHGTGGRA